MNITRDESGIADAASPMLLKDERGDVPGWVLVPFHLCQNQSRLFGGASVSATVQLSPPKAHLPGKGAPNPQPVEGGRPFESGRVREAHGAAGAVGVSASDRVRACGRRAADRSRDLFDDERGDVPGWVLVTLMTAGLVVLIWAVAGPALSALFEQAIQRVSGI
ncbi:hypothetical protein [Microbacterium sp. NPDC097977]|uniref:hypothetical protein n=1 Tax=Microbacterium sp. NPDC097977 TaxID=3155686 RepID=UPI003316A0E5